MEDSTCYVMRERRLLTRFPCISPGLSEVGEELVEQAAAAETTRHPLLGEIKLAEVLRLLGSVGTQPNREATAGRP